MGHRCFSAAITTFPESRDKKMDEIGMLGIIAAAAWLILFILECSMDNTARMRDVLILSAFAGVLAMKPKVLILDEPMAGLDPSGREEMLTLLSKLYEERQISIVLVSHNMDDVAKYADRILVMNEGELVLDGVPKKVFHYQDELEQIGLGVPQMTHLIHRLEKETGCRLGDAITLEEGLPLIEQWWHAKGTSR